MVADIHILKININFYSYYDFHCAFFKSVHHDAKHVLCNKKWKKHTFKVKFLMTSPAKKQKIVLLGVVIF